MAMHVFFDTTEAVADKTCRPRLGRIGDPKLHTAAAAIGATLYLPDLALEEIAHRRWRRLKVLLQDVQEKAEELRSYVNVSVGAPPDAEATIAMFRREAGDAVAKIPVVVVPSSTVALREVLDLSLRRVPPFVRAEDPTGFHDAVILLAAITYAEANRLGEMVFVSADSRHQEWAIKDIAANHNVRCEFVPAIGVLTEKMASLAAAHLKSMHDVSVTLATQFINTHLSEIQRYVDSHPPTPGDFRDYSAPVTEVVKVRVDSAQAIPTSALRENQICRLSIFAKGVVDVVQQYFHSTSSAAEDTAWTWYNYATTTGYSTVHGGHDPKAAIYLSTGRPVTISRRELTIEFAGEAEARFTGRAFVGPPTILTLEVRPQPANDTFVMTTGSAGTTAYFAGQPPKI